MPKEYRSDAFAAIHETMEALHEIGAVDKQTMREFDDALRLGAWRQEARRRSLASAHRDPEERFDGDCVMSVVAES